MSKLTVYPLSSISSRLESWPVYWFSDMTSWWLQSGFGSDHDHNTDQLSVVSILSVGALESNFDRLSKPHGSFVSELVVVFAFTNDRFPLLLLWLKPLEFKSFTFLDTSSVFWPQYGLWPPGCTFHMIALHCEDMQPEMHVTIIVYQSYEHCPSDQ